MLLRFLFHVFQECLIPLTRTPERREGGGKSGQWEEHLERLAKTRVFIFFLTFQFVTFLDTAVLISSWSKTKAKAKQQQHWNVFKHHTMGFNINSSGVVKSFARTTTDGQQH